MKRRLKWAAAAGTAALLGYLLLFPTAIEPLPVEPEPALPLSGPLAPNQRLASAELIELSAIEGPEDVAVEPDGSMVVGTHRGELLRIAPDGKSAEVIARTGGRPLGLAWHPDGRLIVADAIRGLMAMSREGELTVLATEADGRPFGFTNDVDVARDGTIYFSDASDAFGYGDHVLDLLEGRPHGRLLRHDPERGSTEVLLDDLHFANGVALSRDESFVLVNETGRFRVRRYWLGGERRGRHDSFAEHLPGYPDGISRALGDRFWVAMFTVRNPVADRLAPHPWLKRMVARLPRALWPKPKPYGLVLALGPEGDVLESLHDPTGEHVRTVTSAEEHQGVLYLGTLHDRRLARLTLTDR